MACVGLRLVHTSGGPYGKKTKTKIKGKEEENGIVVMLTY